MDVMPEEKPLWQPSPEFQARTNMTRFMRRVEREKGLIFNGYHDLWRWSVDRVEDFWAELWKFYDIQASRSYKSVLSSRTMPGALWFEGARLNYAEHAFRHRHPHRPALLFQSERHPLTPMSWETLERQTASIAAWLRSIGAGPGDRVASYMPNIPEAVAAFLACASIGAIWSSCSPDFGTRAVIDRFRQIAPKVLFAVDGYQYGGKGFDRRPAVEELCEELTTLEVVVLIPYLDTAAEFSATCRVVPWNEVTNREAELNFIPVPFSHPLWVLYSSGTTGLPKPLVHGHGGILLEFHKFLGLHLDISPGDRFFWFSTTGWVMWNIVQGGLLTGATSVLYDGNPAYPSLDALWQMAAASGLNVFGTSAAFLTGCLNSGLTPGKAHDLSRLKVVGSTGSPLPPEGFRWVYENVKPDVWLASVSGGTDPCTAFVGSSPLLPVYCGELQCRCLGVDADAFDEQGCSLVDQVGELVIKTPMPSMPLYLWNDPDGRRYRASYFDMYPGVWRHGDWIRITSRGSAVITGRSDSTLNRLGVRIGSSEIYSAVEDLEEIADSLVIGYEIPGGGYFLPLFVVLKEGLILDEALKKRINTKIRQALSPRHVPDAIYAIPEVPRTLNMKKLEVPIKRILQGTPVDQAVNVDSMANPAAIRYFVELTEKLKKSGRRA